MKTTILTVTLVLIMCGALNGMDHRKSYTALRKLQQVQAEEKKKSESAAQAASSASEATIQRAHAMYFHELSGSGAGAPASVATASTGTVFQFMQDGWQDDTTMGLSQLSVQTAQEHPMDTSDEKEPETPPTARLLGEDDGIQSTASAGPLSGPQPHSAAQQFVNLVHHAQAAQALVSTGVGAGQAGHSASSSSTSSSSLSR